LVCFAVNKVLFGVVNGLRRMRAFAIYTSLRYVLIAAGLSIVSAIHIAGAHLAVIWSVSEGGLFVILVGELVSTVRLTRGAGWRSWSLLHLKYGLRGVLATLAYEINTKLDIWMLGALGIAKDVIGIYSLGAALNEGATQLSVVLQNNLNPMMARSLADQHGDEVEALVRRTRRWFVPAFAAACAIGAASYPFVIPILGGKAEFAAGATPFAILMAGLALASPYLPFTQVLLMANRPGWHTVFVVIVVSVNFVADLVLIPRFGIAGAAIATALAVTSSALLIRSMARVLVRVRL
jgi:O-antigen/teichoic acid export membrane protein